MPLVETTPASGGGGGSGTVTSVSSANSSVSVATPTTTPVLTVATLDVIATNGPPAADVPFNAKKITGLANGAAAQDAAAFGQIPTALPPSGAAGGDLAGTYPNPTIGAAKVTVAKLAAAVTLDAIATANATAAAVAMNAKKITGLAAATAATDAASLANTLDQFGAPAANVPFNAKKITGLAAATAATDAASLANTLDQFGAPAADLSANSHKITNLTPATANADAAAYSQLGDRVSVALGYKTWNVNPSFVTSSLAPVSQRIYVAAVWLPPGIVVTGVVLSTLIPAAGTKPTSFVVGISSATTMLRQSGDLSANGGAPFATAGPSQLAFSSTYTTLASDSASGLYYVVFLQNGSYGTTQQTIIRGIGQSFLPLSGAAGSPYATAGAGQTVLPANGSAITIVDSSAIGWWVGVY